MSFEVAKALMSRHGTPKTDQWIIGYIHRNSREGLSGAKVRREVTDNGEWYFLTRVAVGSLRYGKFGAVEPTGLEDMDKPVVVGRRGYVLDGRHRAALAKESGIGTLPAYVSADWLGG